MKIICVDNFDRDNVSDRLVAENVSMEDGQSRVAEMNAREGENSPNYYKLVPYDHRLYAWEP